MSANSGFLVTMIVLIAARGRCCWLPCVTPVIMILTQHAPALKLQMNLREDLSFTITEMAHTLVESAY